MRPWEEDWYRNNDAAFLLGYNRNREVIGKVVKKENSGSSMVVWIMDGRSKIYRGLTRCMTM